MPERRVQLLLALLCVPLVVFGIYPALTEVGAPFASYYAAARLVLTGGLAGAPLYDVGWFSPFVAAEIPGGQGSFVPFPPTTALVLVPLALLPPMGAKLVLTVGSLAALAAALWLLADLAGVAWAHALVLGLLSGPSLWQHLRDGQLFTLALLSMALGLWLWNKGHHFKAGLALGVMLPIKYAPGLLVIYFLLRRNVRLAFGALLMAGGLIGLSVGVGAGPLWGPFLTEIFPRHLAGAIGDPYSPELRSFTSLISWLTVVEPSLNPSPLYPGEIAHDFAIAFSTLLAITFMAASWRNAPRADAHQLTIYRISLLTLALQVKSPAAHPVHYVLALFPLVLLVGFYLRAAPGEPPWGLRADARAQIAMTVGLFAALTWLPWERLNTAELVGGWRALLWAPLLVTVVMYLTALPEAIWRPRRLGVVFGLAFALALVPTVRQNLLSDPPEADGARWAQLPGMILSEVTPQAGQVCYREQVGARREPRCDGHPSSEPPRGARRVSRDGRLELREGEVGGDPELFLTDRVTHRQLRLTRSPGLDQDPAFSEDDQRIYFVSDRGRGVGSTTVYWLPTPDQGLLR